jgi:Barstar (barnase inhibitor)
MIYKNLTLDLSEVKTLKQFHELLKETFGFPDFYGYNIHALIDCLSSLRYPDEGMSKVILDGADDVLLITVTGLMNMDDIISNNFLIAVEAVNYRNIAKGFKSSIYLNLIRIYK